MLVTVVKFRFSKKPALSLFIFSTGIALLFFPAVRGVVPPWSGLPYNAVSSFTAEAVSDSRRLSDGGYLLELELEKAASAFGAEAEAGGRVLLFMKTDPGVFMGERLNVQSGLSLPEEYAEIMKRQKAGGFSMLKENPVFFSYADPSDIFHADRHSPLYRIRAEVFSKIIARCEKMGPEAGGLFLALFTGRRDGLSAEETRIFRRAGCSHILALSGMHLGILSGMLLLLLKPLPWKKPVFLLSAAVIFAYLFLTGFGVSLVRAAVMYAICGTAVSFGRRFRSLDVLLLSFLVLSLTDPSSFYTAAFQLSFLAVAGIILLSPLINRILRPWMPAYLSMAFAVSAGAQIFLIPLLAHLFGEIYPAGIIAGILIAPLVTVFIWTGIIYLITGVAAAAFTADVLYSLIFRIAGKTATLPAVEIHGLTGALIFSTISVTLLLCYSSYRRRVDGIPDKL